MATKFGSRFSNEIGINRINTISDKIGSKIQNSKFSSKIGNGISLSKISNKIGNKILEQNSVIKLVIDIGTILNNNFLDK